jgi:hypothetical protein
MTKKKSATPSAASVRAKLLKLARERGDDFQLVLLRYANERLLFRLSTLPHAKSFVLKGAALFTLWTGAPHRATRDLDLLGFGDPAIERMRSLFTDVLRAAGNHADDDSDTVTHPHQTTAAAPTAVTCARARAPVPAASPSP